MLCFGVVPFACFVFIFFRFSFRNVTYFKTHSEDEIPVDISYHSNTIATAELKSQGHKSSSSKSHTLIQHSMQDLQEMASDKSKSIGILLCTLLFTGRITSVKQH